MISLGLPTTRADWERMGRATRLVLTQPRWGVTAALVSFFTLSLLVLPLNLGYLSIVVLGGQLPLDQRVVALVELYPLWGGTGDVLRGALLYAISGVIGVNLTMLGYHLLEHDLGATQGSTSTAGTVVAALGAGCPTCGAGIVAGGLSVTGLSGLLVSLPLHGLEFLLGGIGVALLALHWTVEGMRGAEVNGCPVDLSERGGPGT